MSRIITLKKIINVTDDDGTFTYKSRPIFLSDYTKVFATNKAQTFKSIVPAGMKVVDFVANFVVNGATASDTTTVTIEGCMDPFDQQTTLSSSLTAVATTLPLTERTGLPQYENVFLLRADLTGSEYVRNSSAAATGSGNMTVVRAILGTTGITFSSADYAAWSLGWQTLVTNDATTTTATTGAVDVSAATHAAPVRGEITSREIDLAAIAYPAIRLTMANGGTPTVDGYVNLTLICE